MKLFKRISAMMVSLLMAFAMMVPVAAANPTITVKGIGTEENVTLSYLKIVAQDKTAKSGWKFTNDDEEELAKLKTIFKEEFKENDEQALLANLTSGSALSKALKRCESLNGFTPFTDNAGRITEVDGAGLYVVKVVDNTNKYTYNVMAAPINFVYADNGAATTNNATLTVKRSETELKKTVVDETDKVVHNGQTVSYKVEVYVPAMDPTATEKQFTVRDEIGGAEYVKDSVKVKLGEDEKDIQPTFDGNKFSLDLSSFIDDTNSNAGKLVTITYNAIVTSEDDEVTNKATVSRTGAPDYSSDTVDLYEGSITLEKTNDYKTDAERKLLAGAGFNVLDKDGNVLKFVDKGNGTYVLAKNQADTKGVVTEVVTNSEGKLVVKGLDKGTYSFKEVTAPEGYSINETNATATLKISDDESVTIASAKLTASTEMKDTTVGSLPETGGIGTTIFTVGGCAIMVVAAALFFMNKKKHEK